MHEICSFCQYHGTMYTFIFSFPRRRQLLLQLSLGQSCYLTSCLGFLALDHNGGTLFPASNKFHSPHDPCEHNQDRGSPCHTNEGSSLVCFNTNGIAMFVDRVANLVDNARGDRRSDEQSEKGKL